MKSPTKASVQDIGGEVPEGNTVVYHTQGFRQYMGTCKFHFKLDCPHLLKWRPGTVGGGRAQLEKIIIKNHYPHVIESFRCKTCWPKASANE
jgi:hypothetical protein